MDNKIEGVVRVKSAHSFESKQRTEDVKTKEELTFSDMHISGQVLEGLFIYSCVKFPF